MYGLYSTYNPPGIRPYRRENNHPAGKLDRGGGEGVDFIRRTKEQFRDKV
jgi:hypothetical protein